MTKKKPTDAIVRYTSETLPPSQTDWARVDAMTDEDINRAIAEDPDAAPILSDEFWSNARLVLPGEGHKLQITLRLDERVIDYFKKQGRGYNTRINAILRAYVERMEKPA